MSKFSPLRLVLKRDASHEDVFLTRHDVLFRHALKLTRGNRELAEDLLQDAFVYFTQLKPELDGIQNLDAYLYTILKNLQATYLRKGMRDPLGDLAGVDYESAELGLRTTPASRRLDICDQLARICEYAYSHREQSRPHCLLLLRFFHNYYMDELVSLAGNSYPTVRKWLDEAQADIRQALSVTAAGDAAQRFEWTNKIAFFGKPEEFLRRLRELLLISGQDSCPSQRTLRAVFSGTSLQETPTGLLAHLTGCRGCLDRVNELLGLPLLAYRYMEDMGERGRGPKDGSGPTSGTPGGGAPFDLRRARRKIESVRHHEPKRLLVLVNGEERTAHDIALDRNRFVSKLSAREEVSIVEIVSEQDVCLLAFMLYEEPAAEPLEWRRALEMSGGRTLEATLRYADNWPSIEVSYHDPRLRPSEAIVPGVVTEKHLPQAGGVRSWWRKLLEKFERIMISGLNPLLASAAILGAASILCLFVWWPAWAWLAACRIRSTAGALSTTAFRWTAPRYSTSESTRTTPR
jgi:DNA-directed RNA polymerase specialized sigma24 family protein